MSDKEFLLQLKPEAARVDEAMREDLATIAAPLLSEVITYAVFSGGKRIRPLLTVLAARLCPVQGASLGCRLPEDKTALYRLAMLFEYLHAASLLHDDVIDHADQRRGRESANSKWGATPVILAGDYLHTRAMLLAGTIGGEQCLATIGNATAAMVEAEFVQLRNVEEINDSEDHYFAVLQGKTAALIGAACETGMVFAGGNENQRLALSTYGIKLGLAFQIVDDLLDYQGDPAQTGKKTGNDLAEGKMTLPLIQALKNAGKADRDFLLKLLAGDADKRADRFEAARAVIDSCDGFLYARKKAERLVRTAVEELEIFPESAAKTILTDLAHYVLARQK